MWVITTATADQWVNLDKASRIEFSTTDEGSSIQAFIGTDLGAILALVPAGPDHDPLYEKICEELHACMRNNTSLCDLHAVVKRYEIKAGANKGATRRLVRPIGPPARIG